MAGAQPPPADDPAATAVARMAPAQDSVDRGLAYLASRQLDDGALATGGTTPTGSTPGW